METQDQPVDIKPKVGVSRVRKDGKPLFAEKIARANEILQKVGLPDELRKIQ